MDDERRNRKADRAPARLCARFYFDPADPLFADHFPGHPVIPGSLLLDCFQDAAGRGAGVCREKPLHLSKVRKARFIRFGRPGWVCVTIRESEGRDECLVFHCIAEQEGMVLADALLVFDAVEDCHGAP